MTALYIAAAFAAGIIIGRYAASRTGRDHDALKRDRDRWKRTAILQNRRRPGLRPVV